MRFNALVGGAVDLPWLIWSRMNVSGRLDRNQGGHDHAQDTVHTRSGYPQHLRTVELDTGKGLAVLDACRKLGITEHTYAGTVSERRGILHAQGSADPDGTLANSLQHGPPTQQSRGAATRSRNHPACELRTHMGGGTKTPGWSGG